MDSRNYESLTDPHLNAYFNNKRIRRHLIKAGLINRHGDILPPPSYEVALARRTKRREIKAKLSHMITNYIVEDEQKRQAFLRNQFDFAIKRARVQKIRESRHPQQRSMLTISLVHVTKRSRSRNARTPSSTGHKRSSVRAKSAGHPPINAKNQLVRRPTTAKNTSNNEYCEVTMIYYGPQIVIDCKNKWFQPNGDEIVVMQQHCGGENLIVFKGFVKPNQLFKFESRRHQDYPFAVALYINGLIDSRISVCCEYKHNRNIRLGSKYGLFGIYNVQKSQPCRSCRFEKRIKEILPTPSTIIHPSSYRKSIVPSVLSTNEFCSTALLRTPSPTSEKEEEEEEEESLEKTINRISTIAQPNLSPRARSSVSSQNENKIDELHRNESIDNNSNLIFDNKSSTPDRQSIDRIKDESRKSSRVSSSTSKKSVPDSSVISFKNEDHHYPLNPSLIRRDSDDKSTTSSRKSISTPISSSEKEEYAKPSETLIEKVHTEKQISRSSCSSSTTSRPSSSSSTTLRPPSSSSTVSRSSTESKDNNQWPKNEDVRLSSTSSSKSETFGRSLISDNYQEKQHRSSTSSSSSSSNTNESSHHSIEHESESRHSIENEFESHHSIENKSESHHSIESESESHHSIENEVESHHSIENESESHHSSIFSIEKQQQPVDTYVHNLLESDTTSSNDDSKPKSPSRQKKHNEEKEEPSVTQSEKNSIRQYRSMENIVVAWLDATVDNTDDDTIRSKIQLRQIARTIKTFSDPEKCIQWIKEVKNEKIFLIASGNLSENILEQVDSYAQLAGIYIFCLQNSKYEYLIDKYKKIKGVYTDISIICECLKIDFKQWDNDLNTFQTTSLIDMKQLNSEQLKFIQNQLFKEYLLEIEYDEDAIHDLVEYCENLYAENIEELELIKQFENEYTSNDALHWYTKDCFAYHMLNRAIRMKEITILFQMGFFIRDINQQLEEDYSITKQRSTLTLFRGQGMKIEYFEELKQNQGGLISFNGFLSTSTKQNVAYEFAQRSLSNGFPIAVLFRMQIDPTNNSCPYASLEKRSFNQAEYEILFSFKAIFHIESIEQIENNIWQVDLTLINEKENLISHYIHIEHNKFNHLIDYEKLGELLIEMNEFDKAKDLYEINVPDISDPKYTYVYNQLGLIYTNLKNYKQALLCYNLSLATKSNETLNDYVIISNIHNNIGKIFYKQEKLHEALEKIQYALNIQLEHLSSTHPSLINTYDLLAMVYAENDDYQTALEYNEKKLDIQEKTSLSNQSDLALTHFNIGICLENLNRLTEAIDHIQQSIDKLPSNDTELNNRQAVLERIHEELQ
ncbi:unnamed protein product [Rotaria sordida]|uniref:DUF4590 domain-containing protein n=1 Tax=Rotaria sordida TaxID=392033 RepID=A0A813UY51_9BILA|nr:unnamed protein product [Rotaria sordida]